MRSLCETKKVSKSLGVEKVAETKLKTLKDILSSEKLIEVYMPYLRNEIRKEAKKHIEKLEQEYADSDDSMYKAGIEQVIEWIEHFFNLETEKGCEK